MGSTREGRAHLFNAGKENRLDPTEIKLVPIKYTGAFDAWSDHLYDTGLTFAKDKTTSVPAWAAKLFLRHTEFKDMRPNFARGKPIEGERPVVEVVEEEVLIDRIPLENMSVVQLKSFMMKNWGVRVEESATREHMVEEARSLVGLRSRA